MSIPSPRFTSPFTATMPLQRRHQPLLLSASAGEGGAGARPRRTPWLRSLLSRGTAPYRATPCSLACDKQAQRSHTLGLALLAALAA